MLSLNAGQVFDTNYELKRLIDTGGFADVWEAKYLVAGNTVALKIYPRLDEEGIRNIEEEYKKLFELQHSNLVNALHFGKHNGYPYLVMRYYSGGNAGKKIGSCSEHEIAKCLSQIGGALKYLHANDFIHQDIKPNNFLIDQQGNYYLGDLGLSHKVINTIKMQTQAQASRDASSIHTGLTPPPYRAPELYNRQRENPEPVKGTDIWALGASAYEMITGNVPFGDLGGLMQISDPAIKDLPNQYSAELNKLIRECLQKESMERPTAEKLEDYANHYLNTGKWVAADGKEQSKDISKNKPKKSTFKKESGPKKNKNRWLVLSIITACILSMALLLYKSDLFDKKKVISSPTTDSVIYKKDSAITRLIKIDSPIVIPAKTIKIQVNKYNNRIPSGGLNNDKPTLDREQNVGPIRKKINQ